MSSTEPIVVSDDDIIVVSDDGIDVIVISDDDEMDATCHSPATTNVLEMKAFLRARCIGREEDDRSEIERLMSGSGFASLAQVGDGYQSALNKMSILLWVNTVTDDYWSYVVEDAISRNHTWEEVERLLENKNVPIDAFICEECINIRLLGAPVPALAVYKKEFLSRFRTRFPPVWCRYVMTSDTEIIFGNDLPSYWERVCEEPRRYY